MNLSEETSISTVLVGVPTNHTLGALHGGHVWEVAPGSMDEEVGESEPKGRKGSKVFLRAPTGSWNSVLLGLLRSHEDLLPKDRKAGIHVHPVWVTGCPWGHYHLLPYILLGCSCLQLDKFSQCQGKSSWLGEERCRAWSWRLQASVHCGCQWTWAWGHMTCAYSEFVLMSLFERPAIRL